MIESYNGGYKKALLDIQVFMRDVKSIDLQCRTKQQYKTMLSSLLDMLLTNTEEFENFKSGLWKFKLNQESKKLVPWGKERN